MTNEHASVRIPWNLGLGFLAFVCAVGVIGQLYYTRQKEQIRQEKQDYLTVVADMKVAQISQWRSERLADGKTISNAPFLREHIRALMQDRRTPAVISEFRQWLDAVRSNNGYESVLLLDGNGKALVPEKGSISLCGEDVSIIGEAISGGKVVLSDLHKDSGESRINLAMAVPVSPKGKSKSALGAVVLLRIDAERNFYPIVDSWPTPSKTSEVLLVERSGSDILFLNELGHKHGSALTRQPVFDRAQTPSGLAIAGREGVVEAMDYRSKPVLAAMRTVPGAPWHIVVKTDLDELYAPIKELWQIVVIILSMLFVGAASWIALAWRHQRSLDARNNARDTTDRKRTERYLLENEQRTRVALSGANIAVFSQTPDLHYTWMYSPQPGHSPADIAGKTDRDLFPAEEAEKIIEMKREVVSKGIGLRREISVTREGKRSYFELTVEPLRNENGEILGITGASLDITERKKSEEQLQHQKAYFKQLFESAPEAIVLMRQDESILEVNKEFTRLFGYTQAEVIDRKINDLIVPPKHKDEGLQLTMRVAKGLRINAESVRMKKDGSLVDVSILGCPVIEGGSSIALYGIYRDISDRKKAEAALRNSESSFRGLFNSVNDAIYVQDRQGRFLDVNQGAVNMYGFPREYFIGKSPTDLSAPGMNDLPLFEQLVRKAFDGEPQQFEFWGVRSNGEVFPKDIRVSKGIYFGEEVAVALAQDITERKRFEAALQETNKTLDSLIKASPLAITVVDPEGRIQLWNPAAERMFGWTSDEVLGKFNPIVPKEGKDEFLRLQRRALADETANEMVELQRQRKDGTILEVSRSSAVLRDSVGKVKGVVAVLADITERKRALERLRESEERLRLALTAASMMSWELDLTNGEVRWSESGHEFYGMKPNEFAGTREAYMQIVHPEDRAMTAELMEEAIRQGKDYKSEFRIVWPDGSVHWHGAYGRAIRDQSGRPVLMYGIGVDITERKKSEEAIQRLHHAVEQTDEVIIMTDQEGVITYVNPAFEKLYRYSREEAIGKTPRILKSGGMTREYYVLFWRDLLAGKSIRAEHINKSKDGRIIIVEASVNPVYDAKGKLSGFIAVQEDISGRKKNEQERKRLEAQLMQTQKLESIGTLAGGIAHDFNNILGIILAYSSMLRNAESSPEKSGNAVDVINQAVERGASLVRQILTFARKTDVIYGLVNVNIMIKELKKMLSETFPRTISIDAELGSDVPDITADATQLHQAVLNICVNARDAMPAGGKLMLRSAIGTRSEVSTYFPEATSERYVHLSISDTGTGMDESTRQRIFEPFFTTKPKGKGTGLGLSVVYGVVKNHTGFVRVDSEVGKGTTFHLYFPGPIRSIEPGIADQRPLVDVPGGSECILLVEDETTLLDVLAGMLKSKGYRVLVARDGYEAVDTYRDHKSEIAVVVSDLGLPKMTGQDAFMRMKSINPRVKVIFGTGYLDPELKAELLSLGAKGFLAKPYSQEELLRRIRELIDCED